MSKEQKRPPFVPGMALAEGFYQEAVKPILDSDFPTLKYSAALIGGGSEVLGYDTEMSTDHNWGPRVMLFLITDDYKAKKETIRTVLCNKLPKIYRGYSSNFSEPNIDDNGTQLLRPISSGPVNHRVETFTVTGFFDDYLGIDINKELEAIDWLTLPQQKLRSIVAGKVFYDGLELEKIKQRFIWYPHDVWLYILASIWARIGQEEHLTGRAGVMGDEIGSSIIASRLVRDIMRLTLLMGKEYPPYAKWLGTAFGRLKCAVTLEPVLAAILHAGSWQERDKCLATAYTYIAGIHNALGITEPLPTEATRFWGRPFKVINADRFKSAILDKIKDPQITPLMRRSPIGSVDMFSDNTDMLEDAAFRPLVRKLYE